MNTKRASYSILNTSEGGISQKAAKKLARFHKLTNIVVGRAPDVGQLMLTATGTTKQHEELLDSLWGICFGPEEDQSK